MDSGAWSTYRSGVRIRLADYIEFLHENMAWIKQCIALDVILPQDTDRAARDSFANWQAMRAEGLDPMAVLHQGEDIRWIDKYLDAGCTYLGLAGLSLPQKQQRRQWYELMWARLVNKDGLPLIRVHALGDTHETSLSAFPWHSCDSSSWFYISQVLGQFRLTDGTTVGFGNKRATGNKRDIRDFADPEAAEALLAKHGIKPDMFDDRTITEKRYPGTDEERGILARMLAARGLLTVKSYQEMTERIAAKAPVRFVPRRGFLDNTALPDVPPWPDSSFTLYLVSGASGTQHPVLYRSNHDHVLISFAYFVGDEAGYRREKRAYQAAKWFAHDPEAMIYGHSTSRIIATALDEVMIESGIM
jgi:hypothetical protein